MRKTFDLSEAALSRAASGRPSTLLAQAVCPAHLYFLRCEKFIKVGWGASVHNRLASIRTNCPFDIDIEHFVATTRFAAHASEAYLHIHLKDRRIRGEWFRIERAELLRLHDSISDLVRAMERFETTRHDTAFLSKNGAIDTSLFV